MSFDINELIGNLLPEEGIEKSASEVKEPVKPSVADELKEALMTKSASEVAAEAEDLGRKLARRLMEKAASQTPVEVVEGDDLSKIEASFAKEASEAQPELNQAQNAQLAAEQGQVDAAAVQSGNTVEGQTAESLQKGLATQTAQATSEDLVRKIEDGAEDNMQKAAAVMAFVEQGMDFYDAANLVGQADMELQKEAAFAELMNEGYDFEDAVELVKAASEMGYVHDEGIEKAASLQELMASGYTFDDAVELVKEAGVIDNVKKYGRRVGREIGEVRKAISASREIGKNNPKLAKRLRNDTIKTVASRNKGGLTAAGLTAAATVGGAGYGAKKALEKKAAFEELLAQGFSFDEAVEAVSN